MRREIGRGRGRNDLSTIRKILKARLYKMGICNNVRVELGLGVEKMRSSACKKRINLTRGERHERKPFQKGPSGMEV